MSGGLIQLVALGPQDVHLTSEPERTFFKQTYKRHTHFATEPIRQVVSGNPGFGSKVSCVFSRSGDLISNVVVEVVLQRGTGTTFYAAEQLLKSAELLVGGQRFDLLTNTWLRIYDEVYRPIDQREAYRQMTDFAHTAIEPVGSVKRFYVALPFWFCNNPASALPLIALQYHDVELRLEFAKSVAGVDATFAPQVSVWCEYVFLEAQERQWFAQQAQEYMIEQVQTVSQSIAPLANAVKRETVELPFNHPVKFIAWVAKPPDGTHGLFTSNYATGKGLQALEVYGPVSEAALTLNGKDRFVARPGSYFRLHHPFNVFGQAPSVGVYIYSFALNPRAWAPSGTLNFSRIEDARLQVYLKKANLTDGTPAATEDQTTTGALGLTTIEVYARCYNFIKFENGMAAILYAS